MSLFAPDCMIPFKWIATLSPLFRWSNTTERLSDCFVMDSESFPMSSSFSAVLTWMVSPIFVVTCPVVIVIESDFNIDNSFLSKVSSTSRLYKSAVPAFVNVIV